MTKMPNPTRDFPDGEIEFCLENWGSWFGWIGEQPEEVIRALQWKASQSDELPEELLLLRNAFAQFGYAPIEEAVARVQGLEKAFAEIEFLKHAITHGEDGDKIREIVDMCVKFSGGCGVADDA